MIRFKLAEARKAKQQLEAAIAADIEAQRMQAQKRDAMIRQQQSSHAQGHSRSGSSQMQQRRTGTGGLKPSSRRMNSSSGGEQHRPGSAWQWADGFEAVAVEQRDDVFFEGEADDEEDDNFVDEWGVVGSTSVRPQSAMSEASDPFVERPPSSTLILRKLKETKTVTAASRSSTTEPAATMTSSPARNIPHSRSNSKSPPRPVSVHDIVEKKHHVWRGLYEDLPLVKKRQNSYSALQLTEEEQMEKEMLAARVDPEQIALELNKCDLEDELQRLQEERNSRGDSRQFLLKEVQERREKYKKQIQDYKETMDFVESDMAEDKRRITAMVQSDLAKKKNKPRYGQFTPKYASPWEFSGDAHSKDPQNMALSGPEDSNNRNFATFLRSQVALATPSSAAVSQRRPPTADDETTLHQLECDKENSKEYQQRRQSGEQEQRQMQIISMRTNELERCEFRTESKYRQIISTQENQLFSILFIQLHLCVVAETEARSKIVEKEWLPYWRRLYQNHVYQKEQLQIKQWMPEIHKDKKYLETKAKLQQMEESQARLLLKDESERHRQRVEKQYQHSWQVEQESRSELLQIQQEKQVLKAKRKRALQGIPPRALHTSSGSTSSSSMKQKLPGNEDAAPSSSYQTPIKDLFKNVSRGDSAPGGAKRHVTFHPELVNPDVILLQLEVEKVDVRLMQLYEREMEVRTELGLPPMPTTPIRSLSRE